jgi:hypothetical protein
MTRAEKEQLIRDVRAAPTGNIILYQSDEEVSLSNGGQYYAGYVTVTISENRGWAKAHVRLWYSDKVTGELKPGRLGIALPPSELREVIAALSAAADRLDVPPLSEFRAVK